MPFSSQWKWSGLTLNGSSYVIGAPDVLTRAGALSLPEGLQRALDRAHRRRAPGDRLRRGARRAALRPRRQPPPRLEPRALVVLEETLRPDAAETIAYMREQQVDLKLISGDARETVTAVAHAVGVPADAHVIEGPELPTDKGGLAQAALRNTVFCRITPEQKKALVGALGDRGRFTAMIGDGVNDVPALKQARLAVAMGSGSQITKGVADIVLLRDQFSMLPRAVAEGRRIARNIHRLGRLYLTKSVYAGFLILLAAIFDFTFPFLPRQLTVAALLTIGIPSFVLALAPSEGPLYRGPAAAGAGGVRVPCRDRDGDRLAALVLLRRQRLRRHARGGAHRGDHDADRARALLHRPARARPRPRAHHGAELHARAGRGLGAMFAGILAIEPVREFFDLELLAGGQWFIALLCVAIGLGIAGAAWQLPYVQRLELPEGAELEPDDGPEPTHGRRPASSTRSRRRRNRQPPIAARPSADLMGRP